MPDYNLFKLTNSTEIPRFVGSPVPELSQAANILQQKYDTALAIEDELDRSIQASSSSVHDQKILQDLKNKYRSQLKARAEKGDYENMVREVSRDAKSFVTEYAPIAANQQAMQTYRKQLDEDVRAGKYSRQTADKAWAYSLGTYKGLQKDPATGQYRNQFDGYSLGKESDISDLVKKAVDGMEPHTIGSDVRKDVGGFYRHRGGKKVYLGIEELRPKVTAYLRQNPEFQSYLDQKRTLDTWQYANITEQQLDKAVDEGRYDANKAAEIKQLAAQSGLSVGEILRQQGASEIERQMAEDIDQMTQKYERNDSETFNRVMGETEATSRAAQKKIDDEINTFAVPIVVPMPGSKYATPQALGQAITEGQAGLNNIKTKNQQFINGLRQANDQYGKPLYFDKVTGADVTDQVNRNLMMEQQAEAGLADLKRRDQAAWDQASGVKNYTPPKALLDKANAERQATLDRLNNSNSYGSMALPTAEKERMANEAYNKVIQNNPVYQEYKKILAQDAENGSITAMVRGFNSKEATAVASGAFNKFVVNQGFKGAQLAVQKLDGTPLTSKEYDELLTGESEFGGYFLDASGKTKFAYTVGHVGTKDGKPVGKKTTVTTDALPGTTDYLVRTGQIEPLRLIIGDMVNQLSSSENKVSHFTPVQETQNGRMVSFEPLTGVSVEVEQLSNTEMQRQIDGSATAPYRVTWKTPSGVKSFPAESPDQVIQSIVESLKRNK